MDRRACDAWKLLHELLVDDRARLVPLADELGLSEAQCEVLRRLDPDDPLAMCRLADRLGCDRSNVTGIVDRLERRGLVERRVDADDRRVKKLALTAAGRRARARITACLAEPPAVFRTLSRGDQQRLFEILERALRGPSRRTAR